MAWNDLASNQCVSFANLANAVSTGVFTQKEAVPSGPEEITKGDAAVYVNINLNKTSYANKTSNQLVVKSDLEAISVFNYCLGFSTAACSTACTNASV